ncbi:MAG TPA: hypothetical protein VJ570_14205 [Holophagaceae bacterium]|nr:hypothetical protein [Holophagaceae bacterium]
MLKVPTLLLLICVGAQAQTFNPLAQTVAANFADTHHFGVVCDYSASRQAVEDLAQALGADNRITVVDLKSPEVITRATATLAQSGAQMLVLMPEDRYVRDGSFYATVAVHALPGSIPAVGTKRAGLDNGAILVQGPDTGGVMLLSPNLPQGYLDKVWITNREAFLTPGGATVQVLHAAR